MIGFLCFIVFTIGWAVESQLGKIVKQLEKLNEKK